MEKICNMNEENNMYVHTQFWLENITKRGYIAYKEKIQEKY
jgi:hypothetical protein